MKRYANESALLRLPLPTPDDEAFVARLAAIAAQQAQQVARPVASTGVRIGSAVAAVAFIAGGAAYAADLLAGPDEPLDQHRSPDVSSPAKGQEGTGAGTSGGADKHRGTKLRTPGAVLPTLPEQAPIDSPPATLPSAGSGGAEGSPGTGASNGQGPSNAPSHAPSTGPRGPSHSGAQGGREPSPKGTKSGRADGGTSDGPIKGPGNGS